MGIARSTSYDLATVSFDDTALVERMVAISDNFEALWLSPHAGRAKSAGHGRQSQGAATTYARA